MTTEPLTTDDCTDIAFAAARTAADNLLARETEKELARAKLTEQPDAIDDARHKALHDAWQECKIIESKYTSTGDPYDDHLSQVATECADAIEALTQIKQGDRNVSDTPELDYPPTVEQCIAYAQEGSMGNFLMADTVMEILARELTELRKDAERYRWLRDGGSVKCAVVSDPFPAKGAGSDYDKYFTDYLSGEELDAAIDTKQEART